MNSACFVAKTSKKIPIKKKKIDYSTLDAIIPVLIEYFIGRSMIVKWHGTNSKKKFVKGGGPAGGYFGILEYLTQWNESANFISKHSRFKFVDDLSALETIALLTIGISSHNIKQQVPHDINKTNLFIPPQHRKSQTYLNESQKWTENQRMILNEDKTKYMIFNFSKQQFSTRINILKKWKKSNYLEHTEEKT